MASPSNECPDRLYDTCEKCQEIIILAPTGKAVEEVPTVHGFPLLPLELRLKIWAYLLPEPRIIRVIPKPERREDRLGPRIPGEYVASPASYGGRHPVLLHINQESRQEALKTLAPLFECFWKFDTDILFLDEIFSTGLGNCLNDFQQRGFLKNFKHLATSVLTPYNLFPALRSLPSIETYTVICNDGTGQNEAEVDSVFLGISWRLEYIENFISNGQRSWRSPQYQMASDIQKHPEKWRQRGSTCVARQGYIENRAIKFHQQGQFFWKPAPMSQTPKDRNMSVKEQWRRARLETRGSEALDSANGSRETS